MTLQDKITLQSENQFKALAFKEGFFYKVYNEGAWLLRSNNFKINQIGKGTLKSVFVGFPESVMKKMSTKFEIVNKLSFIEINTSEVFDEVAFTAWKSNVLVLTEDDKKSKEIILHLNYLDIINEIKEYPLATKTPLEVFIWVSDLQKRINKK